MSPRMKLALLYQAELTYDMLGDSVFIDVSDGPTWCSMHDNKLTHVNPLFYGSFLPTSLFGRAL